MRSGARIADRFDVERLAGSGGMGEVWRAFDASTQSVVALKFVRLQTDRVDPASGEGGGEGATWEERFAHEAEVLSALRHPGIVRYVAHGATTPEEGAGLFLAMEWLEGEDLGARLSRKGLTVAESLALAERVADALAVVHGLGVVHRDLKPSNVFLADGDLERPKLLDFGIALAGGAGAYRRVMTASGVVLGTPGYMSPEQARGEREVDARSDVFALGCVLFECLTGKPLFTGNHALAILAKIVFDAVPRVRAVRPDVPPEVDALVAAMLEKDLEKRLPSGAAVVEEIRKVASQVKETLERTTSRPAPPRSLGSAITDGEQRLVSVIAARAFLRADHPDATFAVHAPTMLAPSMARSVDLVAFRALCKPFGARFEILHDGTFVATLGGTGAATDLAAQAARCALALRAALTGGGEASAPSFGNAAIALATGRGVVGEDLAVGEVIDRVAELLGRAPRDRIMVDDVTANLLDARFELERASTSGIEGDPKRVFLRGEALRADDTRTLLGRPTPFVGRERELATLDAALASALGSSDDGDAAAHALVVTGAAGLGKSRLRHELVRRAPEGVQILVARGDPMSAGSSFAMASQLLRAATGILEGEPLETRREKLRARLAVLDLAAAAPFLGEVCGTPFPVEGEDDARLRAARNDASLLAEQIQRAWEQWLVAETTRAPMMIVLESLQWGDRPTIRLVTGALRACAERPLLVMALGRPEMQAAFPELFAGLPTTELRLGDLPRRACERLVRAVVPSIRDLDVDRIVTASTGNALFLEELIRAHAEGEGEVPKTLLAIIHARLERMESEARRVLRAASIFGHAFWTSGVSALLDREGSRTERHVESIASWIASLRERETIVARQSARFVGEEELAFRHPLVREAAYRMLTDGDRILGHRLAAEWLERAGEHDPLVLAEHWDRAAEPLRAVDWYRRAAEQALSGSDLEGAIVRAERAVECGAEGETLGALRAVQAEAHKWRGEFEQGEASARAAMQHLARGSPAWYAASCEAVAAADRRGRVDAMVELAAQVRDTVPEGLGDAREAHAIACARVAIHLTGAGRYELADALLSSFEDVVTVSGTGGDLGARSPLLAARVHQARAMRALLDGVPDAALLHNEAAAEAFAAIGDERRATSHRLAAAYASSQVGDWPRAVDGLRAGLATASRLGLRGLASTAKHNLGLALARLGMFEDAEAIEREAVADFHAQRDPRMEGASRMYLALILTEKGLTEKTLVEESDALALGQAEEEATEACTLLAIVPPLQAYALAIRARVRLGRHDMSGALSDAHAAIALLDQLGKIDEGEAFVRCVHAEALAATGDQEAAIRAISDAEGRLLARAQSVGSDAARRSYLQDVPEHARTLAFARAWGRREG